MKPEIHLVDIDQDATNYTRMSFKDWLYMTPAILLIVLFAVHLFLV